MNAQFKRRINEITFALKIVAYKTWPIFQTASQNENKTRPILENESSEVEMEFGNVIADYEHAAGLVFQVYRLPGWMKLICSFFKLTVFERSHEGFAQMNLKLSECRKILE